MILKRSLKQNALIPFAVVVALSSCAVSDLSPDSSYLPRPDVTIREAIESASTYAIDERQTESSIIMPETDAKSETEFTPELDTKPTLDGVTETAAKPIIIVPTPDEPESETETEISNPDYITPEVMNLVEKVNTVRKSDSIIFIAMSDSHYVADQELNFYDAETNASAQQTALAVKLFSNFITPDFLAHLGDVSSGHASTTPDMLKKQIEGGMALFLEAKGEVPGFVAIGNHDTGIYHHDAQADGNIHTMTGEYLYQHFTSLSADENTVFGGEEYGGYCYRDFPDKKLRVFLLNTSEKLIGEQQDSAMYGAQRVWLANALHDLNDKEDAEDWGFIILSHYPADYGATDPLSDLLKAYVNGTAHTISDPYDGGYHVGDGTYETVDFSGRNAATLIAQFHGHVHNFKADKLYSGGEQYDAHRVCIPNGQFNRENYYGVVGGIDYAEDTSYSKTANSADGTSFVVNVINPDEGVIYSFCYGAGYDRVISYGGFE